MDELRRHGAVRVAEVARELGVSELTVRRDIAALAERNLLTKVHGGATLPSRLTGPAEPPRAQRTRFTIGMVVPSLDYYWPAIVTGARTAAAVLGVNVQLRGSSYDPAEDRRQIGLVLSKNSPTSAHLAVGWRTACAELGLHDDLVVRESVALDAPRHREIIAEVLRDSRRSGITALIVHSDSDAMSVAQYCTEQGLSIPGDLALVSYDDEVAHLAEPALTAVRPGKKHVGRLAVELMVSRLTEGSRRPAQRILVVPELVIRDSSMTPLAR